MNATLLDMQREIDSLKRRLEAFESGNYLAGPKVSVPGNMRTESDLQVGSGVVVGNADPTNNPANGNMWMQEQSALPGATGGILKLLNYKNQLHFVEANGGVQPYAIAEGWTKVDEAFTLAPAHTNLVVNSSLETNTNDWAVTGAGSSIARQAGGVWGGWCLRATMNGAGSTHMTYCNPVAQNGLPYRAGFYARSISGNVNLHSEVWGGVGGANFTLTTSWQWFSYTPTGSGNAGYYFWLGAAGVFEIDGIHLLEAPNHVANWNFETDVSNWSMANGGSVVRQAGGQVGSFCGRVTTVAAWPTNFLQCEPTIVGGVSYTISFYAKSVSGNTALHAELQGPAGSLDVTLTGAFQKFSFTATSIGTYNDLYFGLGGVGVFDIDVVTVIVNQTTFDPPYSDPSMTGSGQLWSGTAYASTTTRFPCYYISGNWTSGPSPFEPGVKLLVFDGGWKQFYSIAWWFDSVRNITVFIPYAGTTYVPMANPIHLYMSRFAAPKGFAHWFEYTPIFIGFSVNPTGSHRFRIDGRTCQVLIREVTGTSNATNFGFVLPVREATVVDFATAQSIDNGATLAGASIGEIGDMRVFFYTTPAGGAWTASGNKYVRATFSYEWY